MTKLLNHIALGALTLLAITMESCSSHESYIPYEGTIRRASEVKVFEVKANGTAPASQHAGAQYVGNFEVVRQLTVSPEQQKHIKDLVLSEDMYVEEVGKSCLHQGKYAISFEYKNIPDLTVVLSASPCSKAYVTPKGGTEELFDLPVDNELEALLNTIVSGK